MHLTEEGGNQMLQVKYILSSADCSWQHFTVLNPSCCVLLRDQIASSVMVLHDIWCH